MNKSILLAIFMFALVFSMISCETSDSANVYSSDKQRDVFDVSKVQIGNAIVKADSLPLSFSRVNGVSVCTDIVYSTIEGYRPLRLDFYNYPEEVSIKPLLIFVHGGSWTTGYKRAYGYYENWSRVLSGIASLGYRVVTVEYRLSSEAPFPAAIIDVKAAINFLYKHSGDFGIDTAKVAVWGASAGANIAATAVFSNSDFTFENGLNAPCKVAAFIGWFGPYDIPALLGTSLSTMPKNELKKTVAPNNEEMAAMLGPLQFFKCSSKGCPPEVLKAASPINYINASSPQTLLIHGKSDKVVPYIQSISFQQKLLKNGIAAELFLIDSVGHDWIGSNQQFTQKASREALQLTIDYLNKKFQTK